MKLVYVCMATLFLVASLIAFADNVEVTEIKDNKGGVYQATELEEGGKFFHDRDYTITNIPKDFLGLTQVSTSADCPGGQDYRLTFEIDRSAYVYQAWDSRHKSPEDRGKTQRVGLQRDIPRPEKAYSLMRHTLRLSTSSTNPTNRTKIKWNCSASTRSSETQSSCGRSSLKKGSCL